MRPGSLRLAGRRRPLRITAGLTAVLVASMVLMPGPASAHGLVQRADLPIPEWLFAWAAAVVLIVSFVALAVLWREPRLERDDWRALPGALGRVPASRTVELLAGAAGVFLLCVVVWSGLFGAQVASGNFAPTFVYVVFWVGLVPASVLFGDVFRAFNPWRAIGRAVAWVSSRAAAEPLPAPFAYPGWLGRWPAAVGLFAFAWFELVAANSDLPSNVAYATLVYSAVTFLGMAAYGVDAWTDRAETFSVYFNLFARIAPFEQRAGRLGMRRPLARLADLAPAPGTVALLAVMIGSVSFDGAGEGAAWQELAFGSSRALESLGLSPGPATQVVYTSGLLIASLLVWGLYRLGIAGARSVGGGLDSERLSGAFVHSLVPIALVYVGAHYFSFLVFQGQAMAFLVSDPLGDGSSNFFGTAQQAIDYSVLGGAAIWYIQVGLVVGGHMAALTVAHDRALTLYERAKLATRSQYWMLAVMVAFTTLALWLLSQANA